jgi:hypothetical protein
MSRGAYQVPFSFIFRHFMLSNFCYYESSMITGRQSCGGTRLVAANDTPDNGNSAALFPQGSSGRMMPGVTPFAYDSQECQ